MNPSGANKSTHTVPYNLGYQPLTFRACTLHPKASLLWQYTTHAAPYSLAYQPPTFRACTLRPKASLRWQYTTPCTVPCKRARPATATLDLSSSLAPPFLALANAADLAPEITAKRARDAKVLLHDHTVA